MSGIVFGAILLAAAAMPNSIAPAPFALESSLQGDWTGALQYKDYRSGALVNLPQKLNIRSLPDGATIIAVAAFDDGPKSGTVYITTVELFDPKSSAVQSASFGRKNKVDVTTSNALTSRYDDPTHWTVTTLENGTDDDKPAEIRNTETRDGDRLTSLEEYRPLPDNGAEWQFRNQTVLTLNPP